MFYKYFLIILLSLCLYMSPINCQAEIIDGWDVHLTEPLKYLEKLQQTREEKIYTGDYVLQETLKEPGNGKQFVLAHIAIQINDENASSFKPVLLTLRKNNLIVNRVKDDTFLADFDMKALPHLNIKRGTHKGYVIYEVDKDAQDFSIFYNNHELKSDSSK